MPVDLILTETKTIGSIYQKSLSNWRGIENNAFSLIKGLALGKEFFYRPVIGERSSFTKKNHRQMKK